jgi:hypothetical protein
MPGMRFFAPAYNPTIGIDSITALSTSGRTIQRLTI